MIRRPTSVLVVEDNPGDARLIQEYLRESPTIEAELTMVSTLASAIDVVETKQFDVILLDLALSDSSGLGSVRALGRIASTTPILVLSGNEDYDLILQTVQAGAQDYLPKNDASTSNLSRAISSAIERQAMLVERDTLTKIGRIISSNLDIDVVFGQFADQVTGIDVKASFIEEAQKLNRRDNVDYAVADFFKFDDEAKFDAVVALDVIEHMEVEDGRRMVEKMAKNLRPDGMVIIGCPSVYSYPYQGALSRASHIHCYDKDELRLLVEEHFGRAIAFSMNDEMVHTGHPKMSWYNFALGFGPK